MLYYDKLMKIRKVKKILDAIAYGSLFLDIAVALDNLLTLKQGYGKGLRLWLTIGLSLEIVVTFSLLLVLILLYHYDKIEWLFLKQKAERKAGKA